jgi:hypothetical protein
MNNERLTFANPGEELEYLRSKIKETEKKLEEGGEVISRPQVVKESLQGFVENIANPLSPEAEAEASKDAESVQNLEESKQLREMLEITNSKGVLQALSTIEKMRGWKLEDDYHNSLVELISEGLPLRGIKDKSPEYKALHMTLYEVLLPKTPSTDKPFSEMVKSMEQLYAGFLSIGGDGKSEADYMVFEIANPKGSEDTTIFISVPTDKRELFERHMLSVFPSARLHVREKDYNIFNQSGFALGSSAEESSSSAYPLQTAEFFGEDPLNIILNSFSKLPKDTAGAAFQIIFKPRGNVYTEKLQKAADRIKKGEDPKEVLRDSTFRGEFKKVISDLVFHKEKKDESASNDEVLSDISKKLSSPIVETNIRLAVSSDNEVDARHLLEHLESAFNQFENAGKNSLKWQRTKKANESDFYRAFTFRLFREAELVILNLKELSTMLHFHTESLIESSPLKQMSSKSAPAPQTLHSEGTLLGVNRYQGSERKVYITDEDRLRHFYTIGQTGTGKSTLLKNMVVEDIQKGNGVCMIDPHGSDILDILASVPEERMKDVIYFDPSDASRPMGLNMLEYDKNRPEQKTFVVNELFSIFQKLYGGVPESMGPMFEQYFRNSALLAIDDPENEATLLDVSRILSNKEFRADRLSKTTNPILLQFWQEIAEKAGGEASLANIVPYITSKFDVFLANDIMRPIVASKHTAFNMREIMDNKKILLVNLSKGRLGDINANLIGLIIVGKILLSALSRADSIGQDLPPFYLYIDEFQNITTNSIATILSEARKYKLSLSIAHQFIAQLEENIRDAVFGNVGSIAAFRVGADDANYLEKQFAPVFTAEDLMNIDNRKAHLKMLVDGRPVTPFDIETLPPQPGDKDRAGRIIEMSRQAYGRDRAEVEREVNEAYGPAVPDLKAPIQA